MTLYDASLTENLSWKACEAKLREEFEQQKQLAKRQFEAEKKARVELRKLVKHGNLIYEKIELLKDELHLNDELIREMCDSVNLDVDLYRVNRTPAGFREDQVLAYANTHEDFRVRDIAAALKLHDSHASTLLNKLVSTNKLIKTPAGRYKLSAYVGVPNG